MAIRSHDGSDREIDFQRTCVEDTTSSCLPAAVFFFFFFDRSALERLRRTIGACVISTFLRSVPIHTMLYYQTFINRYSASNLQSILVLIVTSSGSKNRSANAGSESDTGRRISIAFSWTFITALGS